MFDDAGSSSTITDMSWPLTMWRNVLPRAITVYWFQSFSLTSLPSACRSPMVAISRFGPMPLASTTCPRNAMIRIGVFSE